jgi:tetratricopeptide (TPR) repeat protein
LCSRNQDDSLKALEYINELLNLNPNHSEALNQFGLIMVEQEKLSDARKALISAIEISPGFVEAQRNLAELYILEENYDTGVQTYLRILKNHPEDIPSLLRMAELNREANNTNEASEWAKMVLDLEPEHPYANQFIQ